MKKTIFYSFCILCVILTINSCNKKNNERIVKIQEQVEQIKNSKLIFPDSLKIRYPNTNTIHSQLIETDKNYKVVTFINGECGSCINQLNAWKNIIPYLKSFHEIKFIPIIYISDL